MRTTHLTLALSLSLGAGIVVAHTTAQPPASQRPTLEDTGLCIERAQRQTDLIPGQIRRLCVATPTANGPVDCYVEASHALDLTDAQGVELCRCSADAQPVRCMQQVRDDALMMTPQMLEQCSPTMALRLRVDCTPIP